MYLSTVISKYLSGLYSAPYWQMFLLFFTFSIQSDQRRYHASQSSTDANTYHHTNILLNEYCTSLTMSLHYSIRESWIYDVALVFDIIVLCSQCCGCSLFAGHIATTLTGSEVEMFWIKYWLKYGRHNTVQGKALHHNYIFVFVLVRQ